MTDTLEPTPLAVAAVLSRVEAAGVRLRRLLAHVPDDRLEWSPSPTSRSALRLVAHCAHANGLFANMVAGRATDLPATPEAFFAALREAEARVATREEAAVWLERTHGELVVALAALRPEDLDVPRASPFGPLPVGFWAEQSANHLAEHAGQLAYLQTAWGDLDDHMG